MAHQEEADALVKRIKMTRAFVAEGRRAEVEAAALLLAAVEPVVQVRSL